VVLQFLHRATQRRGGQPQLLRRLRKTATARDGQKICSSGRSDLLKAGMRASFSGCRKIRTTCKIAQISAAFGVKHRCFRPRPRPARTSRRFSPWRAIVASSCRAGRPGKASKLSMRARRHREIQVLEAEWRQRKPPARNARAGRMRHSPIDRRVEQGVRQYVKQRGLVDAVFRG